MITFAQNIQTKLNMKINTVYFSATNTTQTVVTEIAKTIGNDLEIYNLIKKPIEEDVNIPSNEVLLVGMPVYAGRIPSIAVQSLKRFKGNNTSAILVAVYGNRDFDDALVEMQDLLNENGFSVLAAATFIAQHSIFPQTAKNRPDETDFLKMKDFALKCTEVLNQNLTEKKLEVTLPGNRPYKVPGNIPLKMKTNSRCTECGACIKVCPVQAIPADNPHVTDYEKCIHCGRCMTVCPAHAREYEGLLFNVAGAIFSWKNRKRKEPQFFF